LYRRMPRSTVAMNIPSKKRQRGAEDFPASTARGTNTGGIASGSGGQEHAAGELCAPHLEHPRETMRRDEREQFDRHPRRSAQQVHEAARAHKRTGADGSTPNC
jgi:hypothetical protein